MMNEIKKTMETELRGALKNYPKALQKINQLENQRDELKSLESLTTEEIAMWEEDIIKRIKLIENYKEFLEKIIYHYLGSIDYDYWTKNIKLAVKRMYSMYE